MPGGAPSFFEHFLTFSNTFKMKPVAPEGADGFLAAEAHLNREELPAAFQAINTQRYHAYGTPADQSFSSAVGSYGGCLAGIKHHLSRAPLFGPQLLQQDG